MRDTTNDLGLLLMADLSDVLQILPEDQREDASHLFHSVLSETAQPDVVVQRLKRFLDVSVNRYLQLEFLASSPHLFRLFATLVDQSDYLTDILCRNPEYLSWLYSEVDLNLTPDRADLLAQAIAQVHVTDTFQSRQAALRRFKRREFLRIAARDLFAHVPLKAVTEDLSNLADACLEAAYWCARQELLPRYGEPAGGNPDDSNATAGVAFVVLALGKLGGRELNFCSDIDLVFLYAQDGETRGGSSGTIENAVFFSKLGELLIKILAEETADEKVFRVDVRLRPFGRVGPLAVSVDSALYYYQNTARMWERQALIKARPAAGDVNLGLDFLERIRPLIFPRFFDDETLEEICKVKAQSEAYIEEIGLQEIEVKRGKGGIRDIEFTVQMLQLLNGGRYPELQVANTLDAVRALGERGLLTPLEADVLVTNYVFLRSVEHRLQIKTGMQTHKLPQNPVELEGFARRLGYDSAESFYRDYHDKTEMNRQILKRFLIAEGSGNRWVLDVLHPQGDGALGLRNLQRLGFRAPEQARENLCQLYAGPMENPNTMRVRQQFTHVAPVLIEAVSRCGDPDRVLTRVARLLGSFRGSGAVYDLLRYYPHLTDYLVRLADNSALLTNIVIQDPGLFDEFSNPDILSGALDSRSLEEELENLLFSYGHEAATYRFKEGNLFRIGLRDILNAATVEQVGSELTLVADCCLKHILARAHERARMRYGEVFCPFGILGLGKLGGRELGYGSDLDLIFVYLSEAESGEEEYFTAVASEVIRALRERTRYGVLYEVDARLRPYGRQGGLVISARRMQEYFVAEAQGWERLALLKARFVAGSEELRHFLPKCLSEVFRQAPLRRNDLDHIVSLRAKLASGADKWDVKSAAGGMLDVEFIARLLEWRYVEDFELGVTTGTLEVIDKLADLAVIARDEAVALNEAYRFLRTVENRLRLAEGASTSTLPPDESERKDLSRRLGLSEPVCSAVERRMEIIHKSFKRVVDSLKEVLPNA